jgi:hypothetical protein
VEAECKIAGLQRITVTKFGATLEYLVVYESSIATTQIFDVETPVALQNLSMKPADGCIIQNDFATQMPSGPQFITGQFNNLARATPLDHL